MKGDPAITFVAVRRRTRALAVLLVVAASTVACGSSGPDRRSDPRLCRQPALGLHSVDERDTWVSPAGVVSVDQGAEVGHRTAKACTLTIPYRVTTAEDLRSVTISGRLGTASAGSVPERGELVDRTVDWSGTITLPLPAAATTATVTFRVQRYRHAGKAAVVPTGASASFTVELVAPPDH